jgi:inosine/xanthosine triphosphatase
MKQIIVASTNPVKITASLNGFTKMFPSGHFSVKGVPIRSGVSEQPMTEEETFQGAVNRANNAKKLNPKADYWVGLEGGVEEIGSEMKSVVWVVVLSKNEMGKAKAGSFILPPRLVKLIKGGMEMGQADDVVFGTTNTKQKSGAVGLLTNGVIDRTALYEHGVILALIPFVNPQLYK